MSIRKFKKYLFIYTVSIVALIFTLFPFYWMLVSSFTPNDIMYKVNPTLIPSKFTFQHYIDLFTTTKFTTYFINSLYVATFSTLISIIISILGSYSLTRLRYRGRMFFTKTIILSYLLPVAVLFIPMYVFASRLGLADNKNSLLLVYPTLIVPYCCYMLISYFKAIPVSLEEAALIDGCTSLQSLFKIILPIALPSIAVVATFAFTMAWNEYLYALVLTTSPSQQTVTIGIASFKYSDQYIWGLLMSSSVIASIPSLILYLLAQRFMVGDLSAGGVKQ